MLTIKWRLKMEESIKNWLQNHISNAATLDRNANRVAVDLLRHLGKGERPLARQLIKEFSPTLAGKIEAVYPHHWF